MGSQNLSEDCLQGLLDWAYLRQEARIVNLIKAVVMNIKRPSLKTANLLKLTLGFEVPSKG